MSDRPRMAWDSEWVVCPHCEYRHGDAWEWATNDYPQEMNCNDCGKLFQYWAEYSVLYNTASVDTRPQGEDATEIAASFTSGAVPAEEQADAQPLDSRTKPHD